MSARCAELFRQLHYCAEERIVLVGHSHLFREFFRQLLHGDFVAREPELAAQLRARKLENCGCACLDLCFDGEDSGDTGTPIVDVRLLLDTKLVT